MGMDISSILIRSISGYIFLIPVVILYFLCLTKLRRKQARPHIISVFVFCYYLIGVFTMTGIGKLHAFSPRLTLVPFLDMISGPIDTILNVILFVPLGFFLPLLYKKYHYFSKVTLTGFLFSLSIEIVQMFGRGSTDINDLITNTFGTCLGYSIYMLLCSQVSEEKYSKFQAKRINDEIGLLYFVVSSFMIMVTIQPIVISSLFHLG